ncbi:hypothetical protein F5I97DRAFT_1830969 [Phlebopus sp. FC_14]|nr:hypothetical protein F5I97DRAFT_1830969 [Phlebopus sp. FC_14]
MSVVSQYPPELLFTICAHIYVAGLPATTSSLDPIALCEYGTPTALPSSIPPSNWPEPTVRRTLVNLCLVSHAWYNAAKPWLWQKIEVRLPRSWLALVEEITGGEDDQNSEDNTILAVQASIQAATKVALASTATVHSCVDEEEFRKWKASILETLSGPDGSIPPELLSPPASRDPSPRRLRAKSKSPARWKIMRSISDAVQNAMDRNEPGVYVPRLHDPRPGRFVRHIDFNHFRTIGMRRSVEEGVTSRFVTGERVEALLKEMPNLTAFGATEYMDGALTLPVLNELFLRGTPSRGRGRPSRGRGLATADANDPDEEDRERRRDCRDLEAVDLTGCISAVFVGALTDFVNTHLLPSDGNSSGSEDENEREGRRSRTSRSVRFAREEPLTLPGLQRLCLRGVKSIQPNILSPFVTAFPFLTHLDLSATRVTPDLLEALSNTVKLRSLALARCIRLTGESIKSFLVHAPATTQIQELTLYGDQTYPSPLSPADLKEIFSLAPCFTNGELTYLDLSSAPVTQEHLEDVCGPQPKLRSLGLSYIPELELDAITCFIKSKARNVEVLTIVSTSPELEWARAGAGMGVPRGSARQSIALHSRVIRPLCTPPSTTILTPRVTVAEAPTRLRVIELSVPVLTGLGTGVGTWRIIRSKGGRGWYVDTASGWVGGEFKRDLVDDHPLRAEMELLADANGNVNSGVGVAWLRHVGARGWAIWSCFICVPRLNGSNAVMFFLQGLTSPCIASSWAASSDGRIDLTGVAGANGCQWAVQPAGVYAEVSTGTRLLYLPRSDISAIPASITNKKAVVAQPSPTALSLTLSSNQNFHDRIRRSADGRARSSVASTRWHFSTTRTDTHRRQAAEKVISRTEGCFPFATPEAARSTTNTLEKHTSNNYGFLHSFVSPLLAQSSLAQWALNFAIPDQHTLIFIFAFLAIIPLAKLLAFATDELSMRVGQTLAGLMNATLGNAVELIVSVSVTAQSLFSDNRVVVLVLGMCFFAGGLRFSEQGFGQSAVQLNSSLLTISVIAVLLPGAFHMALQGLPQYNEASTDANILKTSRGVAIILLFIYGSYLVFQLFSHKALYQDGNEDIQVSKKYEGDNPFDLKGKLRHRRERKHQDRASDKSITGSPMVASPRLVAARDEPLGEPSAIPASAELISDLESAHHPMGFDDGKVELELEEPQMSVAVSLGLLAAVTVLVAVTAEFLVDSISGLTAGGGIGTEFVGVILLPIVGNAAEHVTAVTVSVKDKLTLSLGVAVGSSIQIALFVIPFIVTLAWILGKPLTLLFDPLESIVMFLSVNYVVQDGKSNWLEGMILMCLYLILGVTFWFYPARNTGTPGIFPNC